MSVDTRGGERLGLKQKKGAANCFAAPFYIELLELKSYSEG